MYRTAKPRASAVGGTKLRYTKLNGLLGGRLLPPLNLSLLALVAHVDGIDQRPCNERAKRADAHIG